MSTNASTDWELVDDDGFIFKRRKKPEVSPGKPKSDEELRPSADAQQRFTELLDRRKKIAVLEAQKIKYTAEIEDWQRLLNTQEVEIRPKEAAVPEVHESSEQVSEDDMDDSTKILELQVQVEAYEELIRWLKELRDRGEQMCKMLEKTSKEEKSRNFKGLIEEVTLLQNSPRFLIHGLTSSQPAPPEIQAIAVSTEVGRLLAQSPA